MTDDATKELLINGLKSFFGFDSFKGLQEDVVKSIYDGNNSFVIMPTGAGKSLCFQLPAIFKEGTAIVVSPLIALMKNQVDSIRAFAEKPGIAEFLNSSLNKTDITRVKENVSSGTCKLLYVAPESLGKQENIDFLKTVKLSFVAIDEAHCISEWGHDFRPEYRKIKQMVMEIKDVPIIALTATATEKVQADIMKNLQMTQAKIFKSSFNRPNLYYEIRSKIQAEKAIIKYIKENMGKSGIVYTLSRKKAEEIAEVLVANGIKARPYHAGLDSATRALHQDQFLMEDIDVIVATIAFGMGIDKPDVRFVIHYDIPKSIESYYQETGRAGRDGLEGVCIAFFSNKDVDKLQKFMKDKPVSEKEIGNLLLNEVVQYSESAICRRKQILNYFGEVYDEKDCNAMCDSCRHPLPKIEAMGDMLHLLKTLAKLNNKLSLDHIVNFMMGQDTNSIAQFKHQNHELYGSGAEKGTVFWKSLIKYAMVDGFLTKDIEKYGLLYINEKGQSYISNPYNYQIALDYNLDIATDDRSGAGEGGTDTADIVLLAMLKDLRKKIAKEKNVPPYIVFQDPSLEEMAIQYPITIDELTQINGVGRGKATKFGKLFLELIAQYCEENEIDRPTDMVVKSSPSKSAHKIAIITSIDKKIALNDISRSRNIQFEELLEELYSIINSGTKINIDYYINAVMDPDLADEAYDYFRTADNDDLDKAQGALGEDFSYEDLMLVRIKFASDLGH